MFIPSSFAESRTGVMQAFMREHPLATLVIAGERGLDAHHLPVHLDTERGAFGTLQGHIARANLLATDCVQPINAVAIFHGPAAYITPSWYATKRETGKVVPTWNYVAVHAHGRLRAIDDAQWLRAHLEQIVAENESREVLPWKISDAPPDYIEAMLRGIVGFEFEITRLEGKWKASQNHPAANREGVIDGLRRRATPGAMEMADIVFKRGPQ
ncbi:MAG: FMN-binding negative transcriptional regulator [Rudaea sp.]|uniref:FMN-binding negative transcriptional regulator n=1 Tax=Rudaea sp. TaxID=2136325 RepID=UPI0039E35284